MCSVDPVPLGAPGALPPALETLTLHAMHRVDAPVVLIDGPAGAGKTTLGHTLCERWRRLAASVASPLSGAVTDPVLVHMDDIYPGWGGLAEGSVRLVRSLLAPRARREPGWWLEYDWSGSNGGTWHEVRADAALIVEGCGTLSARAAGLADLRIWVEAEDGLRKRRALQRDQGGFDDHWEMWQAQFDAFVAAEAPRSRADIVLVAA